MCSLLWQETHCGTAIRKLSTRPQFTDRRERVQSPLLRLHGWTVRSGDSVGGERRKRQLYEFYGVVALNSLLLEVI